MQNSKLRGVVILATLWLGLISGCTKPPDPCEDGSCCGYGKMGFVRELEGMRGEWGPGGFSFPERLASNQSSALTCPAQDSLIVALHLKTNTEFGPDNRIRLIDSSRVYPYRVWGTVYQLQELNGFGGPLYSIVLKKVEPVY